MAVLELGRGDAPAPDRPPRARGFGDDARRRGLRPQTFIPGVCQRTIVGEPVRYVQAQEVRELLEAKPDVVVVDALGPQSYAARHLPRAINLPADDPDFARRARDMILDKDATIVVYCSNAQCHASKKAARRLEALGFRNVLEYEDGLEGWERAGYAFEEPKPPGREASHV